jgi:hypothetical protein
VRTAPPHRRGLLRPCRRAALRSSTSSPDRIAARSASERVAQRPGSAYSGSRASSRATVPGSRRTATWSFRCGSVDWSIQRAWHVVVSCQRYRPTYFRVNMRHPRRPGRGDDKRGLPARLGLAWLADLTTPTRAGRCCPSYPRGARPAGRTGGTTRAGLVSPTTAGAGAGGSGGGSSGHADRRGSDAGVGGVAGGGALSTGTGSASAGATGGAGSTGAGSRRTALALSSSSTA